MGAVYESFEYAAAGTSTNVTVDKPTGTVSGDLLLAFAACSLGATLDPPAGTGWTQEPTSAQATVNWKIAGGSEPASYTFTGGNALGNNRIYLVRISNAHQTAPIDALDLSTNGSGANAGGTVTIAHDDTLLVSFFIRPSGGDGTLATPSGMTQQDLVTTNPAHAFGTQASINIADSPVTRNFTNASAATTDALVAIRTGSTAYNSTPSDTATASDASVRAVGHPAADTITSSDASVRQPNKGAADTVTSSDALTGKVIGKGAADTATTEDASARGVGKPVADSVATSDASTALIGRNPADSLTSSDAHRFDALKGLADSATATEDITLILGVLRSIGEVSEAVDQVSKAFSLGTQAAEAVVSDARTIAVTLNLTDQVVAADAALLVVQYLRSVSDLVGLNDLPSKHLSLSFSDTIGAVSDWPVTNPTRMIAGLVVNHETGAAVEGATLRLFRTNDDAIIAATVSAADGSYSFERDQDDPHSYYVTADYDAGTPVHGVTDRGLVPS